MRLSEDPKVVKGSHTRDSFLVGIPTLGMVPIEFCIAFARMQMPVNAISRSMVVTKTEVGVARNHVAEYALRLKPRPDYLLFLGDDMIPPWDGVIKLWQEMRKGRWDILAGLYYIKQDLPVPIIWRNEVSGWLEPHVHYKPGEVTRVDTCGMDFTMIRPEVFEKIPEPWFETGPAEIKESDDSRHWKNESPDSTIRIYTEDTYFCDKARNAKLKIGVHTGVRVAHLNVKTGEIF